MLLEYCPQCGSMEFKSLQMGRVCAKCSFQGPMASGAMHEINQVRKRAGSMGSSAHSTPVQRSESNEGAKELEARLKSLKGKKDDDVEFL